MRKLGLVLLMAVCVAVFAGFVVPQPFCDNCVDGDDAICTMRRAYASELFVSYADDNLRTLPVDVDDNVVLTYATPFGDNNRYVTGDYYNVTMQGQTHTYGSMAGTTGFFIVRPLTVNIMPGNWLQVHFAAPRENATDPLAWRALSVGANTWSIDDLPGHTIASPHLAVRVFYQHAGIYRLTVLTHVHGEYLRNTYYVVVRNLIVGEGAAVEAGVQMTFATNMAFVQAREGILRDMELHVRPRGAVGAGLSTVFFPNPTTGALDFRLIRPGEPNNNLFDQYFYPPELVATDRIRLELRTGVDFSPGDYRLSTMVQITNFYTIAGGTIATGAGERIPAGGEMWREVGINILATPQPFRIPWFWVLLSLAIVGVLGGAIWGVNHMIAFSAQRKAGTHVRRVANRQHLDYQTKIMMRERNRLQQMVDDLDIDSIEVGEEEVTEVTPVEQSSDKPNKRNRVSKAKPPATDNSEPLPESE